MRLQHEVDILGQSMNQELATLNDSIRGIFNDRKMAVREEQKAIEGSVSSFCPPPSPFSLLPSAPSQQREHHLTYRNPQKPDPTNQLQNQHSPRLGRKDRDRRPPLDPHPPLRHRARLHGLHGAGGHAVLHLRQGSAQGRGGAGAEAGRGEEAARRDRGPELGAGCGGDFGGELKCGSGGA
jgi:hypothetical protein